MPKREDASGDAGSPINVRSGRETYVTVKNAEALLRRRLNDVKAVIDALTDDDGTVDMEALRARLEETGQQYLYDTIADSVAVEREAAQEEELETGCGAPVETGCGDTAASSDDDLDEEVVSGCGETAASSDDDLDEEVVSGCGETAASSDDLDEEVVSGCGETAASSDDDLDEDVVSDCGLPAASSDDDLDEEVVSDCGLSAAASDDDLDEEVVSDCGLSADADADVVSGCGGGAESDEEDEAPAPPSSDRLTADEVKRVYSALSDAKSREVVRELNLDGRGGITRSELEEAPTDGLADEVAADVLYAEIEAAEDAAADDEAPSGC